MTIIIISIIYVINRIWELFIRLNSPLQYLIITSEVQEFPVTVTKQNKGRKRENQGKQKQRTKKIKSNQIHFQVIEYSQTNNTPALPSTENQLAVIMIKYSSKTKYAGAKKRIREAKKWTSPSALVCDDPAQPIALRLNSRLNWQVDGEKD